MNLDLDLSVVQRFFRGIATELQQKRLWPVAAVLVAALVAVPFLLAKSSSPAPAPQAQVPTPPPATATSLPAISVTSTPNHTRLAGRMHDPFANGSSSALTPHAGLTPSSTTTSTSTASNPGSGGSAAANSTASPTGSGTGSSSPGATGTVPPPVNPPSITPGAKPKPAPSGLKADEAYDVSMAMTVANGGINTIDPLQRLSVIPSEQQPLLVELGVTQDGNHVLFAVQPGTIPSGPGACTPGPIDCEILSLGQDQTEALSTRQGSSGASQVALFAITGISVTDYQSAAAADRARRQVSAAGRTLINQSTYPTLQLFRYEPSLGVVVDERNLKVGG